MIKRSLNIGLNYHGSDYELPDCNLDAIAIQDRCVDAGYITRLRVGKYSVQDFLGDFESLRSVAKPSDVTLISFSGHGSQNWGGNEDDRMEEYLCFDAGGEIELLPDDDFRALINQIPGAVFVFLDSCFSGGMDRAVKQPRAWTRKCIPFSSDFQIIRPNVIMSREAIRAAPTSKKYFMFASQENEVSWSTGNGGLFTNSFLQGYDATIAKRRSIAYLMRNAVHLCGQEQTPRYVCIGGSAAKRVF